MSRKLILKLASVTMPAIFVAASCNNQNLKSIASQNEFQEQLFKLLENQKGNLLEKYQNKILKVQTDEQYQELRTTILFELKSANAEKLRISYQNKIEKLNYLTASEKTKYLNEIKTLLTETKMKEILSKATYRNNLLKPKYSNDPNSAILAELNIVKPKNKNFKLWGSSDFTSKIQINKLSYLTDAENVKPIAPFNLEKVGTNVWYQLTVYSFADGNNDGIGDFIGLANNLDYFINLGIDTLYLSLIFPASSYHGYDVIDYTDVAPELGGLSAFKNFLIKAHLNGIKVILDVPFNHTSYEHPWFQKALAGDEKYQKYYNFYDVDSDVKLNSEARDEAWLRPLFKHVKQKQILSPKAYTAKFWAGMPDLNLENNEVRQELLAVHQFWATLGVDGFRYDAFYHIYDGYNPHKTDDDFSNTKTSKLFYEWRKSANLGLLRRTENHISSSSDDFIMFGEWWNEPLAAKNYFRYLNNKALGSVIDGSNYKDKKDIFNGKSVSSVFLSYTDELNLINKLNELGSKWMPFLDNHDVERWINKVRWENNSSNVTSNPTKLNFFEIDAYNYALVSLLSRGGYPILYDGNEQYMIGGPKNGENNGDYNIREAFNWKDNQKVVYFNEAKSGELIAKRASFGMQTIEENIQNPNSGYALVNQLSEIRKKYPSVKKQDPKYITNPEQLFINLSESDKKQITVRDNQDGSYLVYFYGYKNTAGLHEIRLKNNFTFKDTFMKKDILISNNIISSKSDGFYGVFLVKKL
ncbi:alpha-amylase family glycosyl hydrolase [Mycoplasma buteonis]|uniref:alpha-amylase family glycosyl hydrolase n=1 Tax=Mycoplasma buteonis TaxID=171280 RepID=UPI00068B150C|nr:alpha-amylase family glycosyl hydrolase [Mycoplasma buteonis]